MQNNDVNNLETTNQFLDKRIVKTDIDSKNGQNKCPKCGATDIALNVNSGKLRCNYCRHEFEPQKITGMQEDLSQLNGEIIGSGATDIIASTNDILTFKCSTCGAEVVIDTKEATQARCHWCRSKLSVNQQIPNGSIPDVVLPFNVKRDIAKKLIEDFVGSRKFFAHPKFKSEFVANNIMGVYLPYMVVDLNTHMKLIGKGEHKIRQYNRGSGNNIITYYDADLYSVNREYDLSIEGLSIESSADKLNKNSNDKTNNIINAVMPFDIENCVKYDSNYLTGYTSERRDINVQQLKNLVHMQAKDIAKFAANDTITNYDRGVSWENDDFLIKGEQWKAAYLPIWLYSYVQINGSKKLIHYVAVNARTKKTMGSIPIYYPKLIIISAVVEIAGIIASLYLDFDYSWLFIFSGILYFLLIFFKYRNTDARHKYETDTKTIMKNLNKKDTYITTQKGLTNTKIDGVNNESLSNESIGNKLLNNVVNNDSILSAIKNEFDDKKGGK